MKIFLVDDSDVFRSALATLLGALPGLTIVGEAVDADEATSAILHANPDLVILDLKLRTGSGIHVLESVKLLRPTLRVLVLTNHAHSLYRDRCMAAGADHFFDKSADMDRVVELCGQLHRAGGAVEATA
jgi:DNA-binding NarL/FixJ family response regulator